MIVRVFRATVHAGREADFERFLRETGIPSVTRREGLVSTCVGRPLPGGPPRFVVVSVWRDLAALQGFAGARWQEPVIHPSEADVIAHAEVEHYDRVD
jgi:heme-degrading monooxygenase HmoA